MITLQNIYDRSPVFVQNIMCTGKGYKNKTERYGKEYYVARKFLEEFDTWTLQKKLDYNFSELINFIWFAKNNCTYYRSLYKGINIDKINDYDDLKKLPIITKEMIRANHKELVPQIKDKMLESHTGGTTGKSLVVMQTVSDSMKRMAMLDHFKHRIGFEHLQMKRATFNGKHIVPDTNYKKYFWRYNSFCKQMIYSTFHITEESIPYYINSLNKFKPQAIDGFFTCIVDIASYAIRHNIKFNFTPIAVFPTSETLTDTGRKIIEEAFHCPVYNQYASSEGAPFITECTHHKLHIELASGWFENFNKNNEVLVTSFWTHGTPLIRYDIGDIVNFSSRSSCRCNNESLMVNSIEGRKLDFLYNAEGAKINAGNIANLFKNAPNAIIKSQLIQNRKDEVLMNIMVDKQKYNNDIDILLRDEFAHKFGNKTNLIIKKVNQIPKGKSGKHRMIVNNIEIK